MERKKALCSCCNIHADTVDKAQKTMPTQGEVSGLSAFFKVLGDPTRIKMMWALEQGEMCVCDLAVTLGMTKSAISHQLSGLKEAKLVKNRREGKNVFYSIDDAHVSEVVELALIHLRHKQDEE